MDWVGRPDDTGFETESFRLHLCCVLEFRCYHETAGNTAIVQILDVMQTARRAGPSIGQRRDHDIGFGRDRLQCLDRRGLHVRRLGVARGFDAALFE